MLINHQNFEYLKVYKAKHPKGTYDDPEFKDFRPLMRHSLCEEQHHMCAYCCRRIEDNSSCCSVEHIEPRHGKVASAKSLNYDNMVATCNEKEYLRFT